MTGSVTDTCDVDRDRPPLTGPQRTLVSLIEAYQRAFDGRPSPCRFFPSCSSYAHEAVVVHGTLRGGWLTVRRLLRCRPLGPSGFDPVPEASPSAVVTDGRPPVACSPDGCTPDNHSAHKDH